MLLYLAANPWPEIAYAVHHCTQFTHNLKASHGNAVKRICQYLKETQMKGMLLHSRHELTIDCFVDVDFAGQWNVKDPHDPLCVKSQMGYVLRVGKCPVHWVSKLQSEVALSMMEAEYIALSTAMQDSIPLQTLAPEVHAIVGGLTLSCWTYSKVFEDNNGALILATTPCKTPHSKHIAIKYHFFKEHICLGHIHIHKVSSNEQIADCMSKGLEQTLFEKARHQFFILSRRLCRKATEGRLAISQSIKE